MRVLLTGGSSFTGCWFARGLALAGHEVTATLRSSSYDGVRAERVAQHEVAVRDHELGAGAVVAELEQKVHRRESSGA